MEAPLVTVITVTYNSSKYVRDAIESVLAQTYQNIEYIIADDCSTDETWQIICQYNDPRIRAYRNEKNLKEYPNRNKAIDLANGKYLIFIDGDDIIFPHGVNFFVEMMEMFPEASVAIQKGYFNNILYPALLKPEETISNHFYGKVDLLSSSFASNFFKTSILKKEKLSDKYISGDDEIRLRIASKDPVLFVAGWVSWPRETPGQASRKIETSVRILEPYLYAANIFADPGSMLNPDFLADIRWVAKKKVARIALNLLTKGRFKTVKQILTATGIPWKKLIQYATYIPSFHDFISDFDPVNPFKRNFNQFSKKLINDR